MAVHLGEAPETATPARSRPGFKAFGAWIVPARGAVYPMGDTMRDTTCTVPAFCLLCVVLVTAPAAAQNSDLSNWTAVTVAVPDGQYPGDWLLFNGNTTVIQIAEADPTFFCNNLSQSNFLFTGGFAAFTVSDDDLFGFAFGYQDPGHCYILDWKQEAQETSVGFRDEGFVIRKMHGDPDDMLWEDYWTHVDGAERYTILATGFGETMGWQDNTVYDFTLEFELGSFTVIVREGDTVLWEETVYDGDYMSGEFAFYNCSQKDVAYWGFMEGSVTTESYSWGAVKDLFR
jgi:hypothetical protein